MATDKEKEEIKEVDFEGRDRYYMDIDRMINEGLGGGQVTLHNGLIEETTEVIDGKVEKDR